MTPLITTMEPPAPTAHPKTVLDRDGCRCVLIELPAGGGLPRADAAEVREHLLFVAQGSVTVCFDNLNTILNQDETLHIKQGRAHAIVSRDPAKILRIDLPPRQRIEPPIVSLS